MEAQVEAAWGDVSLFLFSKQADLAYPETKISAQETFGDKIQEWANAIIDLAARNKDLALGYIDDALRDAKSFRDMQKYNGSEFLLGKVETVQRTITPRDSSHLARYNPENPLSFGGRPQRARTASPGQAN